jgi:hypothetical protein
MSPELVEEFVSHFDRLRRAGRSTDPGAYAFPNTRGGRIARQRVARIVGEATARASERVSSAACRHCPTPHRTRCAARTSRSRCSPPLRRPLGHGPGRPRRFEDDPRRLRAAATARQARARTGVRHARQAGARAAVRHHQRAARGGARAQFRPRVGPRGHLGRARRSERRADQRGGIHRLAGGSRNGETRTRTGDTTIFSRAVHSLERRRNPWKTLGSSSSSATGNSPQFAVSCWAFGRWLASRLPLSRPRPSLLAAIQPGSVRSSAGPRDSQPRSSAAAATHETARP